MSDKKKLIENYQHQIAQMNKMLENANASIQDFAQVRLLEFKKAEMACELPLEQEKIGNSTMANVQKKK